MSTIRSAAYRALRTFCQAAIAQVTLAPLINVNFPTLKVAAFAGGAAVLALIQRWLDDTPLPSLPPG